MNSLSLFLHFLPTTCSPCLLIPLCFPCFFVPLHHTSTFTRERLLRPTSTHKLFFLESPSHHPNFTSQPQPPLMEVEYQEEYIKNSRGVQLFTCRWLPLSSPKAIVFLCHGYGMECGDFMKGCGTKLASYGYAVFGIDYEGHGRSMGARCYIKKFDHIVSDCCNYFKLISGKDEYKNKKRFLYGESMGGAVALLVHRKDVNFWHGAVLVAPMCKISEKVKPHPLVINILTKVEDLIPRWKIVPTKDVIDAAFKDPLKREQIRGNKLIYQEKPRLKTALELLRTSMSLEDTLSEVTIPFFVLHGEADTVTDPEVSKALYDRASSKDKTIKLYPGMWHGLTAGETDHNIDIVFRDIISWLDKRSSNEHTTTDTCDNTSANASRVGQGKLSSSPVQEECGWKARRLHSPL